MKVAFVHGAVNHLCDFEVIYQSSMIDALVHGAQNRLCDLEVAYNPRRCIAESCFLQLRVWNNVSFEKEGRVLNKYFKSHLFLWRVQQVHLTCNFLPWKWSNTLTKIGFLNISCSEILNAFKLNQMFYYAQKKLPRSFCQIKH